VAVPVDVWDWLMGCGESFEPPATALKLRRGAEGKMDYGLYWWRSELRRRIRESGGSCEPISAPSAREAFDQRAADYIIEASGDQIGHGDDPVGFLIASHRVLREKLGVQHNRLADLVSLILG
jgi:hypothetical protein